MSYILLVSFRLVILNNRKDIVRVTRLTLLLRAVLVRDMSKSSFLVLNKYHLTFLSATRLLC